MKLTRSSEGLYGIADKGVNLEVACNSSNAIMNLIDPDELSGFFKPESHLGSSSELVENAISIAKKRCSQ